MPACDDEKWTVIGETNAHGAFFRGISKSNAGNAISACQTTALRSLKLS
jgi:hypothetical protein